MAAVPGLGRRSGVFRGRAESGCGRGLRGPGALWGGPALGTCGAAQDAGSGRGGGREGGAQAGHFLGFDALRAFVGLCVASVSAAS